MGGIELIEARRSRIRIRIGADLCLVIDWSDVRLGAIASVFPCSGVIFVLDVDNGPQRHDLIRSGRLIICILIGGLDNSSIGRNWVD